MEILCPKQPHLETLILWVKAEQVPPRQGAVLNFIFWRWGHLTAIQVKPSGQDLLLKLTHSPAISACTLMAFLTFQIAPCALSASECGFPLPPGLSLQPELKKDRPQHTEKTPRDSTDKAALIVSASDHLSPMTCWFTLGHPEPLATPWA